MSKFTLKNWQAALSKVYALAAIDPVYRRICLADPRQAVSRVSNIEVPHTFLFEFVDDSKKIVSSFLLPPLLAPIPPDRLAATEEEVKELTEWCVEGLSGAIMMMHTIGGGGTHGGGDGSSGTGSSGTGGSGSGGGIGG